MLNKDEINYYSRQILMEDIGENGQKKLKKSKVLVVGAGGLGCPALQYLCASGIGKIGVIDHDVIDRTNLHRQVLYSIDKIGKNKAIEAKNVLMRLNPHVEIKAYPEKLTTKNVFALFQDYDIILDCTDNYATRFLINDACVYLHLPFVSGSIYRFEGQLSVFNYQNGPTLRCVFPKIKEGEYSLNCSLSGVIGVLPGVIGILQANEVLKIVLEHGEVMAGKMLVYNAKFNSFNSFEILKDVSLDYSPFFKDNQLHAKFYHSLCSSENAEMNEIAEEDIFEKFSAESCFILDVREFHEVPKIKGENIIQIPLHQLERNINQLPKKKNIIVACKSGVRSKTAIKILQEKGTENHYFNLTNGITLQFVEIWKEKKENLIISS